MNLIWRFIEPFLRGKFVGRLLRRSGIDSVRYWLLIDLFGQLSERRELFSQLGRDGYSLQKAALAYYILSALMVIPFLLSGVAVVTYFGLFQAIAAFLLLSILLSETSSSLVNPIEGLVLAHQPIDGATYTAAKLTHLLRILLYLVPGFNLIPAVAGLLLKSCPWYYPLLHLVAAFAVGLVMALFCCALFGWLMRFVPPARMKAVGFAAEMSPWLVYLFFQFAGRAQLKKLTPHWLPAAAGPRWVLAAIAAVLAVTIVVLGIRALSGDYLARVAAIAYGGSGAKSKVRRSRLGELTARLFGGPPARAGFDYVWRMMKRDWQFRRQMIPLIPMTIMPFVGAARYMRISPFSGKFSTMHLFPHCFGVAFYMICTVMVYGHDHKGAWLFLLAPSGAFRGFARGVYARLLTIVAAPHLILLPVLIWYWGIRDAGLFVAYSMAVAAVYLGLELRLIEGVPFGKQPESAHNPFMLLMMILGGTVMAMAVGLQYFVIFRSPIAVIAATLALIVAAWYLTLKSLDSFEGSIRFHLSTLNTEAKGFYTEIEM